MFQTLRGMRDILPDEAERRRSMEAALRGVFSRYGYREIVTPMMEEASLFARGLGEGSDLVSKEMYSFEDRGGRTVTLRPEGTASVLRAAAQAGLCQGKGLVRLCYYGPMFRYEKPQKGRMREFYQYGVEALGSHSPALDAEMLEMVARVLEALRVEDTTLLLNSVGCAACRPAYVKALVKFAEGKKLCRECLARAGRNPLRMLDCKRGECRDVLDGAPEIPDYWCDDCRGHFSEVRENLDGYGVAYKLEPHLVRGLDYYVRTAFEVIQESLGAQDALLGGGRYDGLAKALGCPDVPGIGFAGGVERLLIALPEAEKTPRLDVYVAAAGDSALGEALRLAREMRAAGLSAEVDFEGRSLKAQMKEANRLGARRAVILGEDELKNRAATLKDMETGEQRSVARDELLDAVGRSGKGKNSS
ncbi:MAG: histidine--tRNA ligase [Acidobacteriota bacterium]|nr:MAG: histidine--tRNA ligase [Acidobacteriota bacterium]